MQRGRTLGQGSGAEVWGHFFLWISNSRRSRLCISQQLIQVYTNFALDLGCCGPTWSSYCAALCQTGHGFASLYHNKKPSLSVRQRRLTLNTYVFLEFGQSRGACAGARPGSPSPAAHRLGGTSPPSRRKGRTDACPQPAGPEQP